MDLSTLLRADLDDLLTCRACWYKAFKRDFITDAARPGCDSPERRKLSRRKTDRLSPDRKG